MRTKSPNEVLQIPRDASPSEIVAAVTARTAHFRELSAKESVESLSEIYQAAAFLLWETRHSPETRGANLAMKAEDTQFTATRKRRRKRRKSIASWAPLLIVVPTVAALALFVLYPNATMSGAWRIADGVSAAKQYVSSTEQIATPRIPTPTLPIIPTAGSSVISPANTTYSQPASTPVKTPTSDQPNQEQKPIRACVTISSLNVRSGPNATFPSNSYLLEGECIDLIAQNQAGTWAFIQSAPRPAAESGWVSLNYVISSESLRTLPVATPAIAPTTSHSTN